MLPRRKKWLIIGLLVVHGAGGWMLFNAVKHQRHLQRQEHLLVDEIHRIVARPAITFDSLNVPEEATIAGPFIGWCVGDARSRIPIVFPAPTGSLPETGKSEGVFIDGPRWECWSQPLGKVVAAESDFVNWRTLGDALRARALVIVIGAQHESRVYQTSRTETWQGSKFSSFNVPSGRGSELLVTTYRFDVQVINLVTRNIMAHKCFIPAALPDTVEVQSTNGSRSWDSGVALTNEVLIEARNWIHSLRTTR